MNILKNLHLTYCSNIHAGETWEEVLAALKKYLPAVKQKVCPEESMGVGLRLSAIAARDLLEEGKLNEFKSWLDKNKFYVFTINGFPYGGFHNTEVKDQVHVPDWLTKERLDYTNNLFQILAELLPQKVDGGISTSPLSYTPWYYRKEELLEDAWEKAAANVAVVAAELFRKAQITGKFMHLDIEPEPDGFLQNSQDVIKFFLSYLLKTGCEVFSARTGVPVKEAGQQLLKYIQVCYDVCHFALAWEDFETVLSSFEKYNIRVGKIQISAALEARFNSSKELNRKVLDDLLGFAEPTYLHQVSINYGDGEFKFFEDLVDVEKDVFLNKSNLSRIHFHVPVFIEQYEKLFSTQKEIIKVIKYLKNSPNTTNHLEVETYTWGVLPNGLKTDLAGLITREILWVKKELLLEQKSEIQQN